jgi:hypothetical protein
MVEVLFVDEYRPVRFREPEPSMASRVPLPIREPAHL